MKTYEEWLEEFTTKIKEGYERRRMDRCLAGFVSEVERPARRLIKMSGPMVAVGIPEGGELPPPVTATIREVRPINVGFAPINLKDWADDPDLIRMDMFMMQIGERVAEREGWAIVKGMLDNAGQKVETEKRIYRPIWDLSMYTTREETVTIRKKITEEEIKEPLPSKLKEGDLVRQLE